jgi:hypothetical protein
MAFPPELDPDQYEIRQLQPEDTDAACAILSLATASAPLIFEILVKYKEIPEDERVYALFDDNLPTVSKQIESGLSYGVFNKYHIPPPRYDGNPHSVLWAPPDTRDPAPTHEKLISEIDSPLVSIALSSDAADPKYFEDNLGFAPPVLNELCELTAILRKVDIGGPKLSQATGKGQILLREGTYTRPDYADRGLAKALSHWLMGEMARRGYRTIEVDSYHPAITKIWENPPPPHAATVESLLLATADDQIAGKAPMSYNALVDRLCGDCKRIYVTLVPDADEAALEDPVTGEK